MVIGIWFAIYGVAACVSMVTIRSDAALVSVVICLLCAMLGGFQRALPEVLKKATYAWWATEAIYDRNVANYCHVMRCQDVSAAIFGYTLNQYWLDVVVTYVLGMGYRTLALILMLWVQTL